MNKLAIIGRGLQGAVKMAVWGLLGFSAIAFAQEEMIIEPGGIIGGYTGAACVQGDYAFLNQGTVLTVLDVSGDAFEKAASLTLPGEPGFIAADDDLLFLYSAGADSAFRIVDISDPTKPALIGVADFSGGWQAKLHEDNGRVYIADAESLKVVDASNPSAPVFVRSFPIQANDVFVKNDLVFVAQDSGMTIYNAVGPDSLERLGQFISQQKKGIAVDGNYAYLAGRREEFPDAGVQIIDISDPATPKAAGFFATHVGNGYYVPDIVAVDNSTICAGGVSRLFVGDVTDPDNPVEQGVLNLENMGDFPMLITLDVQLPTAYIATGASSTGFLSVNISDRNNPVIENRLQEPWDVKAIFTKGDTAFVASAERLWIFGFGDPHNPMLLGADTTWTNFMRITVQDNYLYGIKDNALNVIDVADPANMYQVGMYESTNGNLREVSVRGEKAYLLQAGETGSKLEIVDVSNPESITMLKDFALPGEGRDLFMPPEAGVAYVAYFENPANQGFQIIDVSDPTLPTALGGAQTQAVPITIWTADSLTYVGSNSDTTWFLESFNVAAPDAPQRVTGISGPGIITDVMTVDSLVVASLPNGCIHVYDMMTLAYLAYGHSPESIYIAAMWFQALNAWGIFTLNGYIYPPNLMFSGSWGLFYMFLNMAMPDAVSDQGPAIEPAGFKLQQNYPNPFNPKTTIRYRLQNDGHVSLKVFDVRGRHIRTLVNGRQTAGEHAVKFDAGNLATGVYFYKLEMNGHTEINKMTVMQ